MLPCHGFIICSYAIISPTPCRRLISARHIFDAAIELLAHAAAALRFRFLNAAAAFRLCRRITHIRHMPGIHNTVMPCRAAFFTPRRFSSAARHADTIFVYQEIRYATLDADVTSFLLMRAAAMPLSFSMLIRC